MPELMRQPGVMSGFFGKANAHQMIPIAPDREYIALYRTCDLAASIRGFQALQASVSSRIAARAIVTDCFDPIIPRLPAYEMVHADASTRAAHEAARKALGDRLLTADAALVPLSA